LRGGTEGADEAISITYDPNGNMQIKGKQTFSYDIENRLTELEGPAKQVSPRTFDLILSPGWNFFSLPVIPDSSSVIPAQAGIQEVFSSLTFNTDYDQISRYNADKEDFAHYNNTEYNQFEDLEYGRGYLVYVPDSEGCTLSLSGSIATEAISKELSSGWNLIGVPHVQETSVAEALNNLEEGVDYDRIVRYNKETKLFENLSANDLLNPGEAYYLHCLKDTTWNIQPNEKQITEFAYDGDGGRVKRTVIPTTSSVIPAEAGIQTTTYIGSLYEVGSDGTTRNHIFAGSNRIATISSSQGDEAISYYHQDHLGSSSVITDQTGQLVQHLEYLPFGKTQVSTGMDTVSHKFTGKELDVSTGLYYYGARYYDPEIGRFISADTIVPAPYDPQTLNRYAYCRNNPVKYVDPSGHNLLFWLGFALFSLAIADTFFLGGKIGDWIADQIPDNVSVDVEFPTSKTPFGPEECGPGEYNPSEALFTPRPVPTYTNTSSEDLFYPVVGGRVDVNTGRFYATGWQSYDVNALYKQAKNALVSGNLQAYADAAIELKRRGISPPKANSILGVYRDPSRLGFYSNDPIVYTKTKWHFEGGPAGMFDGHSMLSGKVYATREFASGSSRIIVYGVEQSMTPTSWQVQIYGESGGIPSTGWALNDWQAVTEDIARGLSVTKEATYYFYKNLK
jgi:RHS repeat-associated protein